MSELLTLHPQVVRDQLRDVARAHEVNGIPIALARAVHDSQMPTTQKVAAYQIIRSWARYAEFNDVQVSPYSIRYHAARFAAIEMGEERVTEPLRSVEIDSVQWGEQPLNSILAHYLPPAALKDPRVALYGGAARLALKMHAGIDIASELPLSDVDAIIHTGGNASPASIATMYNVDVTGAKIVEREITERLLSEIVTNFDSTMNQVAIHNGRLYYSDAALRDIQSGTIIITIKNDPLFGAEGVRLEDGSAYLNPRGFYRAFNLLLRGRGQNIAVSQENIEREKDRIGRYWLVLLFVKLLPIQNDSARYAAIGHWHDIARRINATKTSTPLDFYLELITTYPTMRLRHNAKYDEQAQARWIIDKLIGSAVKRLYEQEEFVPPQSYTPASLSLSDSFPPYDLQKFLETARTSDAHS